MVLLERNLYGHPLAGLQWQDYQRRQKITTVFVRKCGHCGQLILQDDIDLEDPTLYSIKIWVALKEKQQLIIKQRSPKRIFSTHHHHCKYKFL